MRQSLVVLTLCVVFLAAAPSAYACWSNNGSYSYDAANADLNHTLNDFGMLFLDSHPYAPCNPATVASRLTQKLNEMADENPSVFTGFLAGGNVSLAMATAMQLGPKGAITPELDKALARAGRLYMLNVGTSFDPCGFDNGNWVRGNTCQEDRLIGAAGYAWVGAYFRKSGRPWTTKSNNAKLEIQRAFSYGDSTCRHNAGLASTGSRGPCQGSSTDPVVSINHSNQTPAYGIGQITSMSVALIGFDAMANSFSNTWLTTAQKDYLQGMWTEGQTHTNASGVFLSNCYDVTNPWNENAPRLPCNDHKLFGTYQGHMFPVWYVFNRYGLPIPPSQGAGFMFQESNAPYDLGNRLAFYAAGRYAYYHILTKAYNDQWEPDFGWPRPASFHAGPHYFMGFKYGTSWVQAANNGGSTVDVGGTSQTAANTQFYIQDNNGGELNSGDQVSIRTTTGWYWSAVNGGGSYLYANQTTPITWEMFTIVKRSGSAGSRIEDGDAFVLKAYNNTHYVNTGGGPVAANGSIVSAAVFTFKHVLDY